MRVWACGEVIRDGIPRPEYDTPLAVKLPVEGRNPTVPLWLVLDFDAAATPQGAFDLGDPSDPAWQTTPLKNPEKNYLRQTFPEGDMDAAETRGDALRVFLVKYQATRDGLVIEWGDPPLPSVDYTGWAPVYPQIGG